MPTAWSFFPAVVRTPIQRQLRAFAGGVRRIGRVCGLGSPPHALRKEMLPRTGSAWDTTLTGWQRAALFNWVASEFPTTLIYWATVMRMYCYMR